MKSGKMIPSWKDMKAFLKKNLGFGNKLRLLRVKNLNYWFATKSLS